MLSDVVGEAATSHLVAWRDLLAVGVDGVSPLPLPGHHRALALDQLAHHLGWIRRPLLCYFGDGLALEAFPQRLRLRRVEARSRSGHGMPAVGCLLEPLRMGFGALQLPVAALRRPHEGALLADERLEDTGRHTRLQERPDLGEVVVDKLIGPREIVLRELGPLLAPLDIYAAATISGVKPGASLARTVASVS